MEDEYLRERGADVRQVIERVLQVLSGSTAMLPDAGALDGDDPLVVVAHDISPADMLLLRGGRFAAFVTDLGGPTSHTAIVRSEEHTSELQSLMRISYAVFCLKKKNTSTRTS